MSPDFEVIHVRVLTPMLQEAFTRLIPQLSPRLTVPTEKQIERMLADPHTRLWALRRGDKIEGLLTLVWYDVPSGRKGWIEDVVVDDGCRRSGGGRTLVATALQAAREEGILQVMLTSAPHRTAARALYRNMEFIEAETSVFVRKISENL